MNGANASLPLGRGRDAGKCFGETGGVLGVGSTAWSPLVVTAASAAVHCAFWSFLCTEVFNPEKEREAGVSKSNKKSLRSRQH